MTTLVIHGTMTHKAAHHEPWWWNSWSEGGFLQGVVESMRALAETDDLWKIHGRPVSTYEELQPGRSFWAGRMGQFPQHRGHFMWSAGDSYAEREAAAGHLADYLNAIHALAPDEPLRIIAHSHGCNVVKMASALDTLDPEIFIEKAVFLGCPHFATHLQPQGEWYFPYCLAPDRFGEILNLYSESDSVQVGFAEALPSYMISTNWRDWQPPEAYRRDQDPDAEDLYLNCEVVTQDEGIGAHAALHGCGVGHLVGLWLSDDAPPLPVIVEEIVSQTGIDPLVVAAGDHGA